MSAPEATALLRTPLHDSHVAAGGRLVPFAGYELPVQYKGVVDEHRAVRTAAGLFDVCHMGELLLTGPAAGAVVNGLITNDASKLVDGQAIYTCACNEAGTILDDLIIYRHAAERWLVVCNAPIAARFGALLSRRRQRAGLRLHRSVGTDTALLAFQAPKPSRSRRGWQARTRRLRALGSFRFREVTSRARRSQRRARLHGEDGLEIFCQTRTPRASGGSARRRQAEGAMPRARRTRHAASRGAPLALRQRDRRETNPLEPGSAGA